MNVTVHQIASTLTAALLAGCAVGPPYLRPVPDVPAQWSTVLPATAAAADLSQWWRQLDDPVLTGLVDRALGANRDAREAIARIREARALQRVADAAAMPSVGVNKLSVDTKDTNGKTIAFPDVCKTPAPPGPPIPIPYPNMTRAANVSSLRG